MDKAIGDGNENGAHFPEKIVEVDRTDASAYSEATQFKETISSNELQTSEEIVENEENHSEIVLDSNSVMNRSSALDSVENKNEELNVHFNLPNKPVEIICKDEVNTEQEDCTTQPTELSEYNSEYMLEQQSAHGFMQDDSQNENNLVEGEHTVEQNYIPEVTEQVSNVDKGQYLKQKSETTDDYAESTDNNFISQYESEDNSQTVVNLVDDQPPGNPPEELIKEEDVSVKESEYVIENDDSAEISTEEVPNLVLYNESTTDNSVVEDVSSDPIPDNLLIQDSPSHPLPDESDALLIEEHSSTVDIDPLKNDTDDVQSNDNVTIMAVEISNSSPSDQADEIPTVVEYISSSENNDQHVQESVEVIPIQEDFIKDDVCEEISSASHSTLDNTENSLTELENMSCVETIVDSAVDQDSTEPELKNDVSNKSETNQPSQEPATKKPRKTRKSNFEVPMHILGHNIANPLENVPNGRQLPKPRLGVKVPYCNLTSQIVSKADIEREVMKRSRLKQEQAQAKGEVLFARSLTQRLARKLAPSATSKDKDVKNDSKDIEAEMEISNEKQNTTVTVVETIENDSDLLAILEGEGEEIPVIPKGVTEPQLDETNLKLLEREIALQQLQDLPHLTPKQRIYRGRNAKAVVLASESPTPSNTLNSTPEKPVVKKTSKPPEIKLDKNKSESVAAQSLSGKENTNIVQASSPKKEIDLPAKRQPIEIEPQVKVNMVLKTYSRKRKTSDVLESTGDSPSPKKPSYQDPDLKIDTTDITLPTNVYITKSSRVIKKKVIWDPDEIPVRSPKPTIKPVVNIKNEVVKIAKVVDKNSNTEKVNEKKPVIEKSVKSPEKKVAEKVISTSKKPQEKKQIQKISPKITKTPNKQKKILSEIDRLLMDEGAVKMLYELKNTDDTTGKKKKNVYVVGRAQRDIIKKANQIKNELEQNTSNDSSISLRKKEGVSTPSPLKPAVTVERKMSKDSVRSLHTPPCSPFPQGSMLIRRRSSSSISSSDELDSDAAKVSKRKSDGPKTKKFKKSVEEPKDTKSLKADIKKETPQKVGRADVKLNSFSSFTIKKANKQVTINLTYPADKCFLTVEILEELTLALKKFGNDKDINVMAITSGGKAFSSGLHYGSLVCSKEEERKEKATKLAEKVRDFLLSLLHFPKVLVAGIQGECIGLGVTMLPLFDIIVASDAATFRTPYTQLGCLGEGGFLLSSPKLTNHGLVAELLYAGQTLTADEAFRRGLISRLCWPEKYKDTLKGILTSIANGSKQSLMSTKMQLQGNSTTGIEQALNAESKILIEHWTSAECQKNFTDIENEN